MELTELDGIGPVTAKSLNDVGIFDVIQLLSHSPREVSDLTGMDSEASLAIFKKARAKLQEESIIGKTFQSGKEMDERRKNTKLISTGTKALDKLFDGGIETGSTTEVYGQFGSGKSQFCHTMSVQVQLPEKSGGLEGKVLWIDTENTFRSERIISIAKAKGLDSDKTLENITVARAHNSAEQQLILEEAEKLIIPNNVRLIVVDSSTGLFRSDYLGRGTLAERQQKLNKFITLAKNIAETHNLAILYTNQVMQSPGVFFGDPTRPIGGDIYAHNSTYRVYFRKSGGLRVAKMVDSPRHAETEVSFGLSEAGIVDPEVKEAEDKEKKKVVKKKKSVEE